MKNKHLIIVTFFASCLPVFFYASKADIVSWYLLFFVIMQMYSMYIFLIDVKDFWRDRIYVSQSGVSLRVFVSQILFKFNILKKETIVKVNEYFGLSLYWISNIAVWVIVIKKILS